MVGYGIARGLREKVGSKYIVVLVGCEVEWQMVSMVLGVSCGEVGVKRVPRLCDAIWYDGQESVGRSVVASYSCFSFPLFSDGHGCWDLAWCGRVCVESVMYEWEVRYRASLVGLIFALALCEVCGLGRWGGNV